MTAAALLGVALAIPASAPSGYKPLPPAVLEQALGKLPSAESAAVGNWAEGREQLWLRESGGAWTLWSRGEALGLSPSLGRPLDRVRQYFSLAEGTLANPISFRELADALTAPSGVERISRLFERMIEDRVHVGGKYLFLERGGEATLDGKPAFHEGPEPTRDAIPRLVAAIDDDLELARLIAHDEGVKALDEYGLLKSFVSLLPTLNARGENLARIAKVRRQTVMTLLENGAEAFVFDPASQFQAIVSQDWEGRFIGRWHLHPPHWTPAGFHGGAEPSPPDLDIAAQSGQNLTIAFTADGFDAYDLSGLSEAGKADLKLARLIRYRSADWTRRFSGLHRRIPPP